jgi:endonuclease YncB( thermonuclease family)
MNSMARAVRARQRHSPQWPALALLLAGAMLATASVGHSETLIGRVVKVSDGDTLTLLVGREQVRVRVDAIDAPEIGQAFGERARRRLSALCAGRVAEVESVGRDRYRRTLGDVRCDGQSARETQLRDGLAWVYRKYVPDDSPLHALEAEAREARRGLWQDPDPVPPWVWRKAQRGQ